jgi:general secretion pathway protein D
MFRFMALEGINAVMVITPQPKYLAKVEEWLERLDLGGGEAGQRLYVYDVKNVKAVDLATTLSDIFGGGGGSSGCPRRATLGRPPHAGPGAGGNPHRRHWRQRVAITRQPGAEE